MGEQSTYRCSGCGAQLTESMKGGKITCTYCGTVNVVQFNIMKDNMLICPNCRAANDLHAEYCAECGDGLYLICPKCKTSNKADAAHCIKCGSLLGEEIKLRNLYFAYLAEAKWVKKIFRMYNLLFFIPIFALIIRSQVAQYSVFGMIVFVAFPIFILILLLIFKMTAMKKAQNEVEKINSAKVGFSEFFDLYLKKHYWSESMVGGEKRKRFLTIVKKA
ncbi:MAG: zinc ribbon domain-containing protein [Anaerolineaceae bacterium]